MARLIVETARRLGATAQASPTTTMSRRRAQTTRVGDTAVKGVAAGPTGAPTGPGVRGAWPPAPDRWGPGPPQPHETAPRAVSRRGRRRACSPADATLERPGQAFLLATLARRI